MASLTESLRTLHRIHRQLSDLRDRLARGPKQVQVMEANVKKADEDVAAAKATHKQARIAADEKQLQLKQREAKLSDLSAKLMAANSNKEYQLLKDQIAADKQANSVLADEILEALDKIDQLAAAVKTAEQNLGKQKDELAKVKKRVDDQQQGLESELARVSSELTTAEEMVPEDFKSDYLRLAKSRGADAMAPVEDESCGGCFQMLAPQTQDLLRRDKPVFCKSCGRLLYLPE
jgi:predicted  nucleic acid-binding Zn-ribbon protein